MAFTYLTDSTGSALNGSQLNLQANNITFEGDVFSNVREIPHQDRTGAFSDRLGSGFYSGFGNPKIVVQGQYSVTKNTSGSDLTLTNFIDFVKWGFNYLLTDDLLGSKYVKIVNYTFQRDLVTSGSEGMGPTYNIEFVEVHQ